MISVCTKPKCPHRIIYSGLPGQKTVESICFQCGESRKILARQTSVGSVSMSSGTNASTNSGSGNKIFKTILVVLCLGAVFFFLIKILPMIPKNGYVQDEESEESASNEIDEIDPSFGDKIKEKFDQCVTYTVDASIENRLSVERFCQERLEDRKVGFNNLVDRHVNGFSTLEKLGEEIDVFFEGRDNNGVTWDQTQQDAFGCIFSSDLECIKNVND